MANDTLEFKAGNGISISANASENSLTISSTGGGGGSVVQNLNGNETDASPSVKAIKDNAYIVRGYLPGGDVSKVAYWHGLKTGYYKYTFNAPGAPTNAPTKWAHIHYLRIDSMKEAYIAWHGTDENGRKDFIAYTNNQQTDIIWSSFNRSLMQDFNGNQVDAAPSVRAVNDHCFVFRGMLPNGNLNTGDYWRSLKPGYYFSNTDTNPGIQNAPTKWGHVTVMRTPGINEWFVHWHGVSSGDIIKCLFSLFNVHTTNTTWLENPITGKTDKYFNQIKVGNVTINA